MNLPLVAADVRRRIFLVCDHFRLLTSAATVHGAQGAIKVRGCLSLGERAGVRASVEPYLFAQALNLALLRAG